ncbi:lactonase family protein [Pandoraea sp. XJJ-1]|uniref:lactonase family protein n=1 Tax=Pandoraea sp. XJJ-1 TaxID=3002643 RepID=UPI002281BBC9|nr:lactonase family protein [Pandoraea sp. XJJ-1]WAL81228.1 lactonase family protein [Pandoraea sp. XJJ-1]
MASKDQSSEAFGMHDASRRRLLKGVVASGAITVLGSSAQAMADEVAHRTGAAGQPIYAYVGSRTTRERNARGDGITVYRLSPDHAELALVQVFKGPVNPSFLALNRAGDRLYAVHGDLSDISAFAVDKASGTLEFINRQSTKGHNPVHLAIDPTGQFIVVSNHLSSSLAVLPITANGGLGEVTQLVKLDGPIGPHRSEQKLSKPHFNAFDPTGRYVIVPDKGLDRTFAFRFSDGKLNPAATPFVVSREGAGPRHLAFHPNGHLAYIVNELDSTVTTYAYDGASGALSPKQIVSALPDTFTGNSRASEIEVAPSGRFVYSSNRGHDSISVFSVDAQTGHLTFVEATSTQGKTPRFFRIAPGGQCLYALNEASDSIVAFAINDKTGKLTPTGFKAATGSPVCMVFSA